MVDPLDNFLIVFHALRPLCVILVDVMTSITSHSVNQVVSRLYGAIVKAVA